MRTFGSRRAKFKRVGLWRFDLDTNLYRVMGARAHPSWCSVKPLEMPALRVKNVSVKTLENKQLAGELRIIVNACAEDFQRRIALDELDRLEEAARRLEFGYTPPEQPAAKSALEEKRDQEKHEAFMAVANRLKSAGLGGHGMFVLDQATGDAFIFTSHKSLLAHCASHPGNRTDYRSLSLVDDLGRKFDICHNGDYGKKSLPAPVEE